MTPTYPDLKVSHITKVHVAKVRILNLRSDVRYYSFSVFTADWKPIPFASQNRVVEVQTNKSKIVEIYIRSKDADRVVYICSESKLFKGTEKVSLVSSRICSKVKK